MSAKPAEPGLSPEQMRAAIATLPSPDRVFSPFGELRFFDGVPTADTVHTVYDALDLIRGVEVFLNCLPGASVVAMRRGLRPIGVSSPAAIALWDPSADSRALILTSLCRLASPECSGGPRNVSWRTDSSWQLSACGPWSVARPSGRSR